MSLQYNLDNNTLTINLVGYVSSSNAQQIEEEIFSLINNNTYENIVIDAEELEYISSAGLRIILKIRKLTPKFKVINARLDVYDIFETTGFTDMMTIEKAYRKFSVEGLDIIGQGAKGTVYRYDEDTIIKVYNDSNALAAIQNERECAKKAFVLGLPTAISYDVVKVGDKLGSVFELLESTTLSKMIANDQDNYKKYAKTFATILKDIHSNVITDGSFPNAKKIPDKWFNNAKGFIDDDLYEKIFNMYQNVEEKQNLLHMDYHTNNILVQKGEPLIIDMDTLSIGNPIFELANIYVCYVGFLHISNSFVENFIGFSADLTKKFYDEVLKVYFDSEDTKKYDEKIRALGLVRVIYHVARRNDAIPNYKEIIKACNDELRELLNKISDLNL